MNGDDPLLKVLSAIDRERATLAIEVLVVSRLGPEFRDRMRGVAPWARWLDVNAGTPIPQMRAAAFNVAAAPLIAVIEDHVVVPRGWSHAVVSAARETGGVVGGPVDNLATSTLIDRAAFLCEYSHCLPPGRTGISNWLPGNNVAYPASMLRPHAAIAAAGGWENEVHEAIQAAGGQLFFVPEMVAGHDMSYSFGGYMAQRYLFARSYAGNRVRGAGFALRASYAIATLALPALLLLRISRNVLGSPVYRKSLLMSLPLLVLFVVAWAAGEVAGYLAGPGDALGKVR